MKQTIKLKRSDIKRIVTESVKRIVKENYDDANGYISDVLNKYGLKFDYEDRGGQEVLKVGFPSQVYYDDLDRYYDIYKFLKQFGWIQDENVEEQDEEGQLVWNEFIKKRINESKNLLNEGPGAGYEVIINGIQLDANSIKVGKSDGQHIEWEANIVPCDVDNWEVQDYYYGFNSGEEGATHIDGGIVRGYVDADIFEGEELNPEEVKQYLFDCDFFRNTLNVKYMYGCGYMHYDLPREFELGNYTNWDNCRDINTNGEDDYAIVIQAIINAPEMAQTINDCFEHRFDDDEEQEGGEMLQEAVKKALKKLLKEYRVLPSDAQGDTWKQYDIDWNQVDSNPEEYQGNWQLEVEFFDHTQAIGSKEIEEYFNSLEDCCKYIENYSKEDAYDDFLSIEECDEEGEPIHNLSAISFNVLCHTDGAIYEVANTHLFIPKH